MEAPLAALTGGTGFLGRHIVRALVADGWRVRLLARREPPDFGVGALSPEVTLGDLDNRDSLERLCRGAQAVVHAAGLIKARRPQAFWAVNAAGAGHVATAAQTAAPGAPFILISSLAARSPEVSPYALSKHGGEVAVQDVLAGEAKIVRLPAIYGPGDRETLPLFRAAAVSPILPVLRPDARLALIHAQDAARSIAALAAAPVAGGVCTFCDQRPEGYGLGDIMTAAAAAFGRRPALVAAPDVLVRAVGQIGDLARALGATPMMTSGKAREILQRDWTVRPDELATGIPAPSFGLADGFRQTVSWYRAAGWLAPEK